MTLEPFSEAETSGAPVGAYSERREDSDQSHRPGEGPEKGAGGGGAVGMASGPSMRPRMALVTTVTGWWAAEVWKPVGHGFNGDEDRAGEPEWEDEHVDDDYGKSAAGQIEVDQTPGFGADDAAAGAEDPLPQVGGGAGAVHGDQIGVVVGSDGTDVDDPAVGGQRIGRSGTFERL